MGELLRLEHIDYHYGDKYYALKDVSAVFNEGERIAVLGNNGAGKSTFFLCCNGVLRPQRGEIFLKGQALTRAKKDVLALRQAVGLVFQEPDSQIIAGTVANEVSFGPMNLRLPRDEVVCRVTESLERMNLDNYQDRAPQYLSGGEKKRVSIADILAMRPEMILFDEPTDSLDPENVAVLEQTFDDLSRAGTTIVISTHDVDFAYRFAKRAIVFSCGKVIADAAVDEVFASDSILKSAGLKKPLLYEAFEVLQAKLHGGKDAPDPIARRPRTIAEFGAYIDAAYPDIE